MASGPPCKRRRTHSAASTGNRAVPALLGTEQSLHPAVHTEQAGDSAGWHIMNMLPPEVLIEVFMYLSIRDTGAVAQVCKAWHHLAYQPRLWEGVTARLTGSSWCPSLVSSLDQRRMKGVCVYENLNGHHLRALMTGISSLKSLMLFLWPDNTLDGLDDKFYRDFLKLTTMDLVGPATVPEMPAKIFENATALTTLRIGFVEALTDQHFTLIRTHLRNLETLSFAGTRTMTDEHICTLTGVDDQGNCTDPMTSLKHLKFEECYSITNDAVETICIGLPGLKSLDLFLCTELDFDCMEHVAKLTQLERLILSTDIITRAGLRQLAAGRLPNLVDLRLIDADRLTNRALFQLTALTSLRRLTITESPVNFPTVLQVARRLPNLDHLSLHDCNQMRFYRPREMENLKAACAQLRVTYSEDP